MRRWLKALFSIIVICTFIIITPKALNEIKMYREVIESSERLGVDNSALFYTEEHMTAQAELELKERIGKRKN